jgi:hypothetical protein
VLPVLLLLVPCVIWAVTDTSKISPSDRAIVWTITVATLALAPYDACAAYRETASLRAERLTGKFTLATGVVAEYEPAGTTGISERFAVVDPPRPAHWFYVRGGNPGYDRTALTGSPVRAGARVRIADAGGHILRLEIAR